VLPAAAASLVTPQGHLLTLGNAWDMDCFFAARLKLPAASCRESSKGKEGLRPFAR
jgi:hypothetical protein